MTGVLKPPWSLPRSRSRQGREEKAGPRGWRRRGRRRRRRLRKAELGSCFCRLPLLSTRPRRLPSYSLHRICNPPSCSKLFLLGQDCTGRVGQVELRCHPAPLPSPWNREPPRQPSTSLFPSLSPPPAPRFSAIPALSIPQFHCRPLVMYLVWGLWDWYLVFGSVLLIFCWMNFFFWVYYFSFVLFPPSVPYFSPNKFIAIAAVQPASQDF